MTQKLAATLMILLIVNSTNAVALNTTGVLDETQEIETFDLDTHFEEAIGAEVKEGIPLRTDKEIQPEIFEKEVAGVFEKETETFVEEELTDVENQKLELIFDEDKANLQGISCTTSSLSDEEKDALFRFIRDFLGNEIDSGIDDPNTNRDKLDSDEILMPLDEEKAVKQKIPNQAMTNEDISHMFGRVQLGAYSFGVVVDDTIRAGRCVDEDLKKDNRNCPLEGQGAFLRNSSTGFRSISRPFMDLFEEVTGKTDDTEIDEADLKKVRETLDIPEKLKDLTIKEEDFTFKQPTWEEYVALEDKKEMELKQVKRVSGEPITNTFKSDNYYAAFMTNCATPACVISVYSLFDKYYNAWFSGEMLLSMGLPGLYHSSKRLFNAHILGGVPESEAISGGFLNIGGSKLADKLRAEFTNTKTWLGKKRLGEIEKLRRKYPSLSEAFNKLAEPIGGWDNGYALTKGTSFRQWYSNEFTPKGKILDQLASDPQLKKATSRFFNKIHEFTRTEAAIVNAANDDYRKVLGQFGYGSKQEMGARIKFAQTQLKVARDYDELRIDVPEWLYQKDKASGFYKYAIKVEGSDAPRWLYNDPEDWIGLEKKFLADGHWMNWEQHITGTKGEIYRTRGNNLLLYEAKQTGEGAKPIYEGDLETIIKTQQFPGAVKMQDNVIMPADAMTTPYLKKNMVGEHKWSPMKIQETHEMSPEEFAQRLIHNRALLTTAWEPVRNSKQIVDTLNYRGFTTRQYANILDKAMVEQDQLIKNYLNPKGGLKWTGYAYGFDWLKKGGGMEEFSAYMLPESYKSVSFKHKNTPLYSDSFVDFFSNAGSDTGDLFKQVVDKLPYSVALDYVTEQFEITRETYKKLTGNTLRSKVENVAVFSSTNQNCGDCSSIITSPESQSFFNVAFSAPNKINSTLLEETVSKEAKRRGQTLIAFAFHTDLEGEIEGAAKGSIDLTDSMDKKETCRDVIQNLGVGSVTVSDIPGVGKILYEKPATIGALLAFSESLSYVMFNFSGGIMTTILQQTLVSPEISGCVDVLGGYYAHIYAPSEKEKNDEKTASKLSTEKVLNTVEENAKKLLGTIKDDNVECNSAACSALEAQKKEIENFVSSSKRDVLQATIISNGHTGGQLKGIKLFTFWRKGEEFPVEIRTEGKERIKDGNGMQVVNDYEKGTINITFRGPDGQLITIPLGSNPDIARMNSMNTAVPGEEVPAAITKITLPDVNSLMLTEDVHGKLHADLATAVIFDCIKQAVLEQSNLELKSSNISEAFGDVISISTDTHPSIKAWPDVKKIEASGTPNYSATGENARVNMYTKRNTLLRNGKENNLGLLKGIAMKNGSILVDPDTNSLIIWLKRNEKANLNQEDVEGMKVKQNSVVDSETLCEEPALDLEAIPVFGSDLKRQKVENFNKSVLKVGPFQSFDTPTKRFIFYSQRNEAGDCEQRFKIIDKETGETLVDVPIDSFNVTPDGVKIIDDKGNVHDLKFTADNGVPKIQYNNQPPETLTTAQGRNGSFWFDPETGSWFAENGNLLPLVEAFKQGALTSVGPGGNASSVASGNNLNIDLGKDDKGGLVVPSLPENILLLALFVLLLFGFVALIRSRKIRGKNLKKQF